MKGVSFGDTLLKPEGQVVHGDFVDRKGERYFCIRNYDSMPPFFMSVVSAWDHWMFVSSTGGLTCGRRNPEQALFPYYTDDKIHDACFTTGPKTLLRIRRGGRESLWLPFDPAPGVYRTERNLYRNLTGNRLLFEEKNLDFDLVFRYSWSTSDRFGFIRHSELENCGGDEVEVHVLDGLRNLLPAGVDSRMQNERSTLLDAYKQGQVVSRHNAALFTLSSIPTDRAEPSEALRATVAWSVGLEQPALLISDDQVADFSMGGVPRSESSSKGRRCSFFQCSSVVLAGGITSEWYMVADVEQGPSDVVRTLADIEKGITAAQMEEEVEHGTARLRQMAGSADAFQLSADERVSARHYSNTLYNIMRGGVFYDAYHFPREDFLDFTRKWNHVHGQAFESLLQHAGETCSRDDVLKAAGDDPTLRRLALEYLPLTFSRRHGDPSRPWNYFSIDIRDAEGNDRLNYQGNWRDIFQNWEALSISYPQFIESFIAKFLNASTVDGYNPYRIGRSGFEWEVLDPDDPWSHIGYWGDHQVNYLLELLELSIAYRPSQLRDMLSEDVFVYADVPYRIKNYRELVSDPRNSMVYDRAAAERSEERVRKIGSDGRLVTLADGSIYHVNLLEKLLLVVLTKLAGFVPGGGIWMNTQRPEWNDANNALAGYGLSMVTLCYLRRLLVLVQRLLAEAPESCLVSEEVADLMEDIARVYSDHRDSLDAPLDDRLRKKLVEAWGMAGEKYRTRVYQGFSGTRTEVDKAGAKDLLGTAQLWLEKSIEQSRRSDRLYHSYNLVDFSGNGIGVESLDEMLEGQVAVLNSGYLAAHEAVELLDALRNSRLYRSDKNSYLLYPERLLPGFLHKNVIPAEHLESSEWLRSEVQSGRRDFVQVDVKGALHFNGRFRNSESLRDALEADDSVDSNDADRLCEIWEEVFNHRRFTGRSGAMYKYEGLGCIYWHMVSKLALAVAGVTTAAAGSAVEPHTMEKLSSHYREIVNGIGVHSDPREYGAFPIDPYSHTTGFSGVQQPGMTGQVKEDFIARFTELGVRVEGGSLYFRPTMLRRSEFLAQEREWQWSNGKQETREILPADSLGFTLCGVPVVYRIDESAGIRVAGLDGDLKAESDQSLGLALSRSVFRREGRILRIEVDIPASSLC